MDLIKVNILNWSKINGRNDISNPSWFKFKNKLFYDSDFFDFSHSEIVFWVYLLCEASLQNKGGLVTVNMQHVHRMTNVCKKDVNSALKKLKSLHIVELKTLRGRYADVTAPYAREEERREEKKREEKKREENTLDQSDDRSCAFDLESLYLKYPRKLGKQQGLKKAKTSIKGEKDFEDCSKAIDHYVEYCQKNATEAQYIKHFSTFMTSWRDWVTPVVDESQCKKLADQEKRKKELAEREAYEKELREHLERFGMG